MKSIEVNSLPLKEVIRDIAQIFDVPYTANCGEYLLNIPASLGEGSIRGIDFEVGLGLIQYNCKFNIDLEIHYIINKIHPLKFLYVQDGVLLHRFENKDRLHRIEQFQSTIVASSKHNGHVLFFKAGEMTKVNSLEINRERFQSKLDCDMENKDHLESLFMDTQAERAFYYKGNYSLEIADLIKNMFSFSSDNFTRKFYLEGMAYQILSQQIVQYQDDQKDENSRTILRSSELKQVHNIASQIENSIADIPTVENMAKEAGLNVNKLQEGFKKLYGTTVNNYIQAKRLEAAYSLLTKSELSISEIVHAIGLSSKSYFSKIFKEKHSISPSDFRKKHRSN